jgi:CBS-domain-containing membrane protein
MQIKLFDDKFKNNKLRYILQCFIATLTVFIVLLILDALSNAVIIASLGASSFIAFTMPHADVSRPRFLIGGYFVGVFIGAGCYYLSQISFLKQIPFYHNVSYIFFGALSVGLTIFIMSVINTEHPPAASLALGLVLNECHPVSIIVVLIGIISLCFIKTILKRFLINLL